MQIKTLMSLIIGLFMLVASSLSAANGNLEALKKQVEDTERAFAKTMADRDFDAFVSFLADEAIFFSGPNALNGKQQVADTWKAYYEQAEAPFSWEPAQVEVLASGTLALSTGPVRNTAGKQVATFTSTWRLEPSGEWRIIFDKGCEVCDCSTP